jgi:hypothetical protein
MDIVTLANLDEAVPVVAIAVGGGVMIIWIFFSIIEKMSTNRQREITKRELAAYVAEGSMTPQDAERILKAGPKEEDE